MRRTIGLLLLSVAAILFLTGCGGDTATEYAEKQVQLAKICVDGGGTYEHNGWSGYLCDFGKDD